MVRKRPQRRLITILTLLAMVDKDGNGTLDKEEFTELLHKTHGLDRFQDSELQQKAASIVAEIFDRVSASCCI